MKKPPRSCTVYNIADLRGGEQPEPPQPAEGIAKKPAARFLNGYSRRRFLSALMITASIEKAKRRAEVRDPHASQYVVEALAEAGYEANGLRYVAAKKAAA